MPTIRTLFSRIAKAVGISSTADDLNLVSRLAWGRNAPAHARDLFHASVRGDESAVEALLVAFPKELGSVLNDALALAARHGNTGVAKKLIHAGADVHELQDEPLRWAAEAGQDGTVEYLLSAGANPHVRNDAPLRSALANGHTKTARVLQTWPQPSPA
jgi:ankyrin repeat protein